ncbi:hypothetical protein GCM10009715_12090 [Paeniglutamicibacter psychrophenolicus]|uniref:DNA-binding GntR family transcriptional regulator n=1 Tax=Paeniglutamicibacter psychrophenolicus TaxID=257454 RepID=A0ABS4W899_9MICC|nr:GntR family transcriptional regulator [Paeniglutamicibacter psychrophenolicus]MBP2372158.1 DNA-binding GntR family transcriptional regulator [Paeniglutamicibacter psychrophenolicus]
MTTGPNNFVAPATLGEAVAAQLRSEIATGTLPPGAPVRDAEIAARLGVSITPVRESIAVLISEGLIDVLPNKRRQVTTLTQRQAEELMDALGALLTIGLYRIDGKTQDIEPLRKIMLKIGEGIAHPETRPPEGGPVTQMVNEIFALAGNSELRALSQGLVIRSSARISLYPYKHLAPLWNAAFTEIAELLPDTKAAAVKVSEFFELLVATMSTERTPDQVVTLA